MVLDRICLLRFPVDMHIGFIKQKFVPFGGGEGYLSSLAMACVEQGHDVTILTSSDWPDSADGAFNLLKIPINRSTRSSKQRSFSDHATQAIRQHPFDCTLSLDRTVGQDVWRAGEGVHSVWLERRKEFETGLSSTLNQYMPGQRTRLALEAACVQHSRRIIANSKVVLNDLQRVYQLPSDQVELIPNGIQLDRFTPPEKSYDTGKARRELGLPEGSPVILFVGSGFRRKGLPELFEALQLLPEALLVVLGRDPIQPWMRRAQKMGLHKRVRFLGPQKDLVPWYRAADVTTLPSWFDSFGFTGLESVACGTPLVTTAYCGVSQILEGHPAAGQVVKRPDQSQQLAAALSSQLTAPKTNERSQEIRGAAKAYSIEENIQKTLKLIYETGTAPQLRKNHAS